MTTTTKAVIRTGRKFEQVLQGARQVFMTDGFEGASVDDIAKVAGVSKATLYSYFPDKRLLFMEVARCECDRQADEALDLADFNAPPRKILHLAGQKMIEILISEFSQRIFRICVGESERFPELGREFYQTGPMMGRQRLGDYLRGSCARGELRIEDFDLAADQFIELCKVDIFPRLIFGIDTEFSKDEIDRVVDGAVDMFMARYGAEA
ncbi:TetR/AcrR family transcriptional regulator [Thalassovita mangrovi]|uniref:TetR family transcriptional regulator n=1 Tax=Thalassovita mangrovi TaxID=2692236 RepID=A0A6L8LHU0_9RHOB|nr:TetR/AcrR family transcriptional regulator [Thalassovita mangrovi]MYM55601.1 TetR family transcriptional regulator [Thalassovita mangrovi]